MELVEHTFEELSELKYHIFTTDAHGISVGSVLVVSFEGEYGFGCKGNDDATFIDAIIAAAKQVWETSHFVLDYRSMSYEWGDELPLMVGEIEPAVEVRRWMQKSGFGPSCSATLISDRNRDAINSLIASEYGYGVDASWLFEDLDTAFAAFEDARQRFLKEASESE